MYTYDEREVIEVELLDDGTDDENPEHIDEAILLDDDDEQVI